MAPMRIHFGNRDRTGIQGDGKPGMPVSSNPLKGADIAAAFSGSGRSRPHHTNNRSAFDEHLRVALVAAELKSADLRGLHRPADPAGVEQEY